MTSKEYRATLGRLPIENPTPSDMALLCPHLTTEQALAAFNSGSGYVACPSLRVKNAFQIVSFLKESTGPAILKYSYAGRTPESYDNIKKRGEFLIYPHTAEAIEFANTNWGDELILDTWVDVSEFHIEDPSDLYQDGLEKGSPKTKAVIRIGLNRALSDLINDNSKPTMLLIDEAISEITLDPMISQEITGNRGFTVFNCCAYCGHGLGLSWCNGCGHRFKDDQKRSGWETSLPPKMVKLLQENGHVFKKEPVNC